MPHPAVSTPHQADLLALPEAPLVYWLRQRHVILSGPPGTGKTELAMRLPRLLWEEHAEDFMRVTTHLDQPPVTTITEWRHGYATLQGRRLP